MGLEDDLEQRVHANLDAALENDYDVRDWSVEDIIIDLICFAADVEDEKDAALKPHIQSWLAKNRNLQ